VLEKAIFLIPLACGGLGGKKFICIINTFVIFPNDSRDIRILVAIAYFDEG
jgi:hypothetical protein